MRPCLVTGTRASDARLLHPQYVSGNFTTWRWLILVGCLAPAYWGAEGIARLFEAAVEWRYFEDRRVLYYLIGTTVRCSWTLLLRWTPSTIPWSTLKHLSLTLARCRAPQ